MNLDRLQLDLRPRSQRQALDLGFALLHRNARTCYLAFAALWLSVVIPCTALAFMSPTWAPLMIWLPWWLRPLFERVVIYVLSRSVFGETVTVGAALRAWPRQLGGGWLRTYTFGRPFCPGRSFYAPIWQLEQARGREAGRRRSTLGKQGNGSAAIWFGAACNGFETILMIGMLVLFVFATTPGDLRELLERAVSKEGSQMWEASSLWGGVFYNVAALIIAPIYTACGFTLYLNRRATLEAWDLEIMLRQIKPPTKSGTLARTRQHAAQLMSLLLCGVLFMHSLPEVHAQTAPTAPTAAAPSANSAQESADNGETSVTEDDAQTVQLGRDEPLPASVWPHTDTLTLPPARFEQNHCETPPSIMVMARARHPDVDAQQTNTRKRLDSMYEEDALKAYTCVKSLHVKEFEEDKKRDTERVPELGWIENIAGIVKIAVIAGLIIVLAWLLYRYRNQIEVLLTTTRRRKVTQVAGMDVRPESLPEDVVGTVLRLWTERKPRDAAALLYRATLSRAIHRFHLDIRQSSTEGDCLRTARAADGAHTLDAAQLRIFETVTLQWQQGAYGHVWPSDDAFLSTCQSWRGLFDHTPQGGGQA